MVHENAAGETQLTAHGLLSSGYNGLPQSYVRINGRLRRTRAERLGGHYRCPGLVVVSNPNRFRDTEITRQRRLARANDHDTVPVQQRNASPRRRKAKLVRPSGTGSLGESERLRASDVLLEEHRRQQQLDRSLAPRHCPTPWRQKRSDTTREQKTTRRTRRTRYPLLPLFSLRGSGERKSAKCPRG